MKKKMSTVVILAIIVLTIAGCGKENKTSYDYNQEPVFSECVAWTPKGLYTMGFDGHISCISEKGEKIQLGSSKAGGKTDEYVDAPNQIDRKSVV